ncbi:MAG: glycine dehydrogenase (aminomethyl-transferring) [Candidatus Marinimicrobia bacterium]|nr:glycine dehydrogenase (aminomethyl-transferring) [Candidatus Neomarinimicrobiota bacterium]|tara:strand:+ start:1925 stop:3388 length:1464 start_codon:yes stop_codon:yes gene_type:complete
MKLIDTPIIFTKSKQNVQGAEIPRTKIPKLNPNEIINKNLLREDYAKLPELTEPEIVRHFINLSIKNHHVDRDIYPLGSCTMKYNPKINDKLASHEKITSIHPDENEKHIQGALKILYELERYLSLMTGMNRFTLQPSAGSQGEFAGLLVMQKYHKNKGNNKKYVIIPETAHGTNPASVILVGYKPLKVKSNEKGRVDIDHLKSLMNNEIAGMMLTQPNTLGLFEDQIEEINEIIHSEDGLMYMDGANLNALIGITKPVDMGFDIVHINLHKTFSTPHGGGGPGAGPIGVVKKLTPYLPIPMINKTNENYFEWDYNYPKSIGQLHTYYGNYGILVRAWCYIRTLGENGVKQMTRQAIINANYLKKKIEKVYEIPFSNGTMHEFVASCKNQKIRGIKVLDIAKSLLDYGFHAPTIYFPINIPEALMMEPTESETKETLDKFADALIEIDQKITESPEQLLNAPIKTPVKRLNETKANRELNLRFNYEI